MKLSSATFRLVSLFFILQISTACDEIKNIYESRDDNQLAKAKYWPAKSLVPVGATFNLRTSWREGKMYYIFSAAPLIDPKEEMKTENKPDKNIRKAVSSKSFAHSLESGSGLPSFTVRLINNGSFEIMSLEMNETTRVVDDDSKPISLQQKSNIECSRNKYQAIWGWEVSWRY